MNSVKTSCIRFLITFSPLFLFFAVATQAQSIKQSEETQTLQSLLSEVRLLRKTLQRTVLSAQLSQIIMERLKASNEQVLRLTRTLEDSKREREGIENTIPRMKEQEKIIEKAIEQEVDAVKRARYELELSDTKRNGTYYKQRLEQLQDREQQISTQLRAAQAKVAELESRLDTLERDIESEMDKQQAEDKAQDGIKRP